MTTLKSISMSELAKNKTGIGAVKAGGSDEERGPWVDPYTLDVATPTTILGTSVGQWPDGGDYVQLQLGIISEDGEAKKAGNTRISLPTVLDPLAYDSAEAAAVADASNLKAFNQLLRLMRAVAPAEFSVFASIDKSNASKWVYLNADGIKMSEKTRQARANEIDAAVMGVADGFRDGTFDITGACCFVTKRASNNPARPFTNFSASAD